MQIILNDLEEKQPYRPYEADQQSLITKLGWKLQVDKKVRTPDYVPITSLGTDNVEEYQKGFLGALSNAYSMHRKITINPHDFWFIVLCEIATVIKTNSDACRPLFTKSQDKVDIVIPTDDPTTIDLAKVVEHLRALVPVNVDMFVPELSTMDDNVRVAMYASLCDGLQHYYNYMTFCCGIPEINVGGTKKDYELLLNNVAELAQVFKNIQFPEMVEYMIRVGDIFASILKTFVYEDKSFWTGIFTSRNEGSGGQLYIDGWITDLYFMKPDDTKIENFESSFAIVPYKNLDTGVEFKAVHGGFKRMIVDGYVTTGYEGVIFQKVPQ